jgi:precorrin-2 dehydrogenase / sirohydrochlorin ferrochelatase
MAVVVGAGAVGLRKCVLLQSAGWQVRVVDPRAETLPHGVERVATEYDGTLLSGAQLVVACTNRAEVNARVVADALARGQLVCDATDPVRGNFVFPATWSNGPVQLTLSTGGAAPALAKRLVRELGESLPPSMPEYVALLAELRTLVMNTVPDGPTRGAVLRRLAGAECQARFEREGAEKVRDEVHRWMNPCDNATGQSDHHHGATS